MSEIALNRFIQECKKQGMNVTYPRIAIYRILLAHHGHPSAEDIFRQVKREHPNISLATVYKTMEMLAENNLIVKVTPLHDMARYDCNPDFHHHLVCVKCKKIIDIQSDAMGPFNIPKDIDKEYKILNFRIQIDGICKNCQTD